MLSKRTIPRVNFNIIAAVILALIIGAALIGSEWRPTSPVDSLLNQLQAELLSEQWNAASDTLKRLSDRWQAQKPLLTLNNSRNAIVRFEQQPARVRAGIDVQDLPSAVVDAEELTEMWNEFAE